MERAIEDAFWSSMPAQTAFDQIVCEILRGGLEYEDGTDVERKYYVFVRELLLSLNLFGYAVYRKGPEVAFGVSLTYDERRKLWKPTTTEATSSAKGSRGWRLVIINPPRRYRNHPDSAGFKAMNFCNMHTELVENINLRDRQNSTPTIFTTVSKRLETGATGKPWFHSVTQDQSALLGVHSGATDMSQLVEDRLDAIKELDGLSEQARLFALQRNQGPSGMNAAAIMAKPKAMEHTEHMVTDGRDLVAAPFLRGPEDARAAIESLANSISFAWGVPPQVLGKNVNSERLAGSVEIQRRAVEGFEHLCAAQKKLVVIALENVAPNIKFGKCWPVHVVQRLAPILKPEAAVRLYSCAYGIPESDFNAEMVSGVPAEKKPRRAKTTDERAELAEKKATPNT